MNLLKKGPNIIEIFFYNSMAAHCADSW